MNIHPIWIICLLVRSLLALLVLCKGTKNKYIKYGFVSLLMIIGIPFIFKGYYGSNNETQIAPVFWHEARYTHGIIYISAALQLLNNNARMASILILTDIAFSVLYRIMTDQ